MKIRTESAPTTEVSRSFGDALERAFLRLVGGTSTLLKGGAVAGALALTASPFIAACEGDPNGTDPAGIEGPAIPGGSDEAGKADWAQYEGERDTSMVSYLGGYWHQYSDCNTRGGCQGVDVFIKLRVQPVDGADLASKRVGVVYRPINYGEDRTALGQYFATNDDGTEEWHVRISERAWSLGAFTFNAWYQDGRGKTFYDDNEGEFHAISYQGSYSVVLQDWEQTRIEVREDGVSGTLSIRLADIDYDKDVKVVCTTDNWETVHELGIGSAGEPNVVYWVEDLWSGHERWQVDLDLDGTDVQTFQYAIVYKHGVVNNARNYEFWDNNGGRNYVVYR